MVGWNDVLGVPVRVLSVVSADSLVVSIDLGGGRTRTARVGLYGVETLEWGTWGGAAMRALSGLVTDIGRSLRLELIDDGDPLRLRGVIWDEVVGPQHSINRLMIQLGCVYWDPRDDALPWSFEAAQREAQEQAEGQWGRPEADRAHRVADYPIQIVRAVSGESLMATGTASGESVEPRQVFLHGVEAAWPGKFGRLARKLIEQELGRRTDGWRICEVGIDRWGRSVGVVYHGDDGTHRSLNRTLIAMGTAYDRAEFASDRWGFAQAETDASQLRRGFWELSEDKQPWRALDLPIEVVRVIDGDSVIAMVAGGPLAGQEMNVRLDGIDAPEMAQMGGSTMKYELTDILTSRRKKWRIRASGIDRYKRIAGIIYDEDLCPEDSVNSILVAIGAAYCYHEYADPRMGFNEAELAAKAQSRGMWSVSGLERPWDYRRRKRNAGRQSATGSSQTTLSAPAAPRSKNRRRAAPIHAHRKQAGGGCLTVLAMVAGAACVLATLVRAVQRG